MDDIAIIGMSGRFPGADDVDAFWRNISTGTESFTIFSDDELLAAGVDPQLFGQQNYVRSRPVLNHIAGYDAGFFGFSPREATLADPQQRIFTECVWETLESAGYGTPEGRGTVGVFAGMNISTYLLSRPNAFRRSAELDGIMIGNDKDALATAVAYRLDLRGPAVTVQTFCSTSLVAVHLASHALRRGECDLAVAGGVSIRVPDRTGYLYKEGDQASPDGHVRTFDAAARGSMFGDGASVVTLKRLADAVADRDTVLGVLRASAINNDGALKFSFQAPSLDGQRRCVTSAISQSGLHPEEISYVEAHGTATEVGDPMEVAALTSAYRGFGTSAEQYCLLGSVKPNVGHLDRASGVTGLIKVLQSFRHELIPGTRNFTTPNPEIDFAHSPFRVTSAPTPWPRDPDRPRIAGVNSLGTGGTNAHAIVLEPPLPADRPPRPRRWQVLPVSARSAATVERAAARLATALAEPGAIEPGPGTLELGDIAYTLQLGRKVFPHKRVVVADTVAGAAAALADPVGQLGRTDATVGRRVGFLIAGVGEQYPGMVAALYADEPTFRADVDECLAVLGIADVAALSDLFVPGSAVDPNGTGDLARLLGRTTEPARPVGDAHLVQPAVFVAEYALARLLMRWGVVPEVLVGYSLGEYVAACLSGVLSLSDALRLVAHRAALIAGLPAGAMLAVAADEATVRRAITLTELDVAIRTGSQLVLAGPVAAIEAAATGCVAAGLGCRRLATTHAFHSRLLAPVAAELTDWVRANVTPRPPTIPYLSNVTGTLVTEDMVTDPTYWARHMGEPVEFGAGLAHVSADPDLALVEIGAGASLGALTRAHPGCRQAQWPLIVSTLPGAADQRDPGAALAETVARLWLTGVPIDWPALHRPAEPDGWRPGRLRLPTYPFDRQDYWLAAEETPIVGAAGPDQVDDPTGVLLTLPKHPDTRWVTVPVWRQTTARPATAVEDNWLVYTDTGLAGTLATGLSGRLAAAGARVTLVRPGERFAMADNGYTVRPGAPEDAAALLRALTEAGHPPQRVLHLWSVDPAHDTETQLDRGLHTLVCLARAAGDLGIGGWTLDVVAVGSHRVLPGEPVRPHTGTLLGPCRLIPVEYPGVRTRLIDVDPDAAELLPGLFAELRAEPADQVVALRGRDRWVPDYEILDADAIPAPDPAETRPSATFRRGGTYLVTGGLGGIGLAMAERLAADHQARLVLMGRTPVPDREHWDRLTDAPNTTDEVRRRLAGLRRLAEAGTEVLTIAGDVAKVEDVRRAISAALTRFGRLDGVLHCAGVPAVGLMQFKTTADIDRVLAPKVAGTLALAGVLRELPRPVDFLALFSSTTSATGGGAGQVDYCAANAFLDAYALSDPLPGTVVTAIDWGEWVYNGWTSGLDSYDEASQAFFRHYRATYGISFDEGWRVLGRILAAGQPHVVVSTQDFTPIVAMSRRSSIESHQTTVKKVRDALGRHPRPELSTPMVRAQSPAEEAIAEVWSAALGLAEVGVHDNFFELGGNSLIGMEIIAEVRRTLALSYLPPHLLYQAPTIAALAKAAAADGDQTRDADSARARHRSRIEQRRNRLRSGRA